MLELAASFEVLVDEEEVFVEGAALDGECDDDDDAAATTAALGFL